MLYSFADDFLFLLLLILQSTLYMSNFRNHASQSSSPNQDRAGPSELQSFSDSWKSRFSSMSMKYGLPQQKKIPFFNLLGFLLLKYFDFESC